ncbi:MAG: ABC transporter substrate-binding protein [Parvularculaceae bacterium]
MGTGMIALVKRMAAVLIGVVMAHAAFGGPARADQGAEAFVRDILKEANVVFEAKTKDERFAGIAALVDKYVDMPRVSMFVLGQYARQITGEQKAEYFPLFRRYAKLVYQEALDEYSGERLEVVNSVERTERDIIVNTGVVGTKPGDKYDSVVVHWRVYRAADGSMSIFDAGVDQVWLAVEQQSQFKSVIANNGGGAKGIDALIADLRKRLDD